jgi:thiol-disulfide isomerase/thioredoxin
VAAGLAAALAAGIVPTAPAAAAGSGGMRAVRDQFTARFVGTKAPPFALPDIAGKTVQLSDLAGKVVLLNFWYSSCVPCRIETPDLIKLRQFYAPKGFEVVGINLDPLFIPQANGLMLKQFMQEFKPTYPVVLGDRPTFDAYGQPPIQPISFLVKRDGVIAKVIWGSLPGAQIEQIIAPYLRPPDKAAGPDKAAPPAERP